MTIKKKICKDKKNKLWTLYEINLLELAVEYYQQLEKNPSCKWKFISDYLYNIGIYKTSKQCSSKYYNDCSKKRKKNAISLHKIDKLINQIKNCKDLPILQLSEIPIIEENQHNKSIFDYDEKVLEQIKNEKTEDINNYHICDDLEYLNDYFEN